MGFFEDLHWGSIFLEMEKEEHRERGDFMFQFKFLIALALIFLCVAIYKLIVGNIIEAVFIWLFLSLAAFCSAARYY